MKNQDSFLKSVLTGAASGGLAAGATKIVRRERPNTRTLVIGAASGAIVAGATNIITQKSSTVVNILAGSIAGIVAIKAVEKYFEKD